MSLIKIRNDHISMYMYVSANARINEVERAKSPYGARANLKREWKN